MTDSHMAGGAWRTATDGMDRDATPCYAPLASSITCIDPSLSSVACRRTAGHQPAAPWRLRPRYCLITQTLISGFTSAWSRIGTR
jgi:hypothetical protein